MCQLLRRLRARRRHIFYPVLWIQWLLVRDTTPFYPVCKALSCMISALLNDDTVEGSDCSSLTLGAACVVTCTDGYVAARDTETTMTCIFDSELQSTLMRSSTVSHDGPNAVFGNSCTDSCFDGNAAISGTAASTVWTSGYEGALVSDPPLEVWTLCLDLTLLCSTSCSHFSFISAD